MMDLEVLEILDAGLGATLQDGGRIGWRKFGVPVSGPMDDHAAGWANRLLNNPPGAPVIELLLESARLRVLQDVWMAVTGGESETNVPYWRAVRVRKGDLIYFGRNRTGLWSYVAVEGGFTGTRMLGSLSVYTRGLLGRPFQPGDILRISPRRRFELPPGTAGRFLSAQEKRDYNAIPAIRVWKGPQWELFSPEAREMFAAQSWTVSTQSDRIGYRLEGEALPVPERQILSEPVLPGSIQVPADGRPIVTMRDGPTVGGYPKIGLVHPEDLSWVAQCRPGKQITFKFIEEKV